MTSRPFEDQWHNRVIWPDKRVFDSQRVTSTAGVAAGDQLATRRTRSLPPEPSSCLSAGHYDRPHLAKGRVELCFIEAAYEKVKFCGGISDASIANRLRLPSATPN